MSDTPKSTNTTHRKQLARALAAETGEPYATALRRVTAASDAGELPARLDDAGMAAALRILTTEHANGGQLDDTYGYTEEELAVMLNAPPSETPYTRVSPSNPAILEMSGADYARRFGVGQPRQASDPRDQPVWDLSAKYERLTGSQGLLYISSPGGGADRYVFGGHHDVLGKGTVALGRAEALNHLTQAVNLARAEIHARLSAIRATYGDGGAVELPAVCRECGEPGRYTIDGVTLCTRHRGLLAKFQGLPAEAVTLVDRDATWPKEVHDEYVELLLRLG